MALSPQVGGVKKDENGEAERGEGKEGRKEDQDGTRSLVAMDNSKAFRDEARCRGEWQEERSWGPGGTSRAWTKCCPGSRDPRRPRCVWRLLVGVPRWLF